MKWEHKCSLEWLQARQGFLTASEIKQLIPLTPAGKKKEITNVDRAKILIKKMKMLTEDDCMSYGAAARGHILEPYAIKQYNDTYHINMHHWDDCLIYNKAFDVAYSPDALDIPQLTEDVNIWNGDIEPTKLVEVKSYGEESHIKCILADPMKLEERWQVATAMCISPSIDEAVIVFYNPSLSSSSMGIAEYDRGDLADEMAIINVVCKDWHEYLKSSEADYIKMSAIPLMDEEKIYAEYEAKQRLNP